MLDVSASKAYRKDLKACSKRGYDLNQLNSVLNMLISQTPLPAKHRDHLLAGNHSGERECHIAPDWLLIYRFRDNELYLYRCGTHSDLF